jgi:tripartite-type tricarboxylate transporter receptor subunit TctC
VNHASANPNQIQPLCAPSLRAGPGKKPVALMQQALMRSLFALAALAALGSSAAQAQAQEFPSKPVKIVTPFPVGSGPEGVVRLLAEKLSKTWGQPVTVENRPGGNGFIAIESFKRGATDGHELLHLDNVHLTAYPHLFKRLPYDAAKDFEPLLPLFKAYFFATVASDSKYKTVADIIADAKANPGKLNYGSWSVGNPVHLGTARMEIATNTDMTHIIYKETSQLYTGVANGELAFALGSNATAGSLYRAGKIKYLAVMSPKRLAAFPSVPTLLESGGPSGFEVSGWTALVAPKSLPKAVGERIQRDVEKALAEPDIQAKFVSFGYEPFTLGREAFGQYIKTESGLMSEVIRKTKAALD